MKAEQDGLAYIDQTEQLMLDKLRETGGMKLVDLIAFIDQQTGGKNFGVELDIADVIRRYTELEVIAYDENTDLFYLINKPGSNIPQ